MKNLIKTIAVVGFLSLGSFIQPEKAEARTEDQQAGVCCQTVQDVNCQHPDGPIFDHAVWLKGHTICDD